jgi:hypothetical protein
LTLKLSLIVPSVHVIVVHMAHDVAVCSQSTLGSGAGVRLLQRRLPVPGWVLGRLLLQR